MGITTFSSNISAKEVEESGKLYLQTFTPVTSEKRIPKLSLKSAHGTETLSGGQPSVKQNGPKDTDNKYSPTDYDSIEKKAHFDDAWIKQKAINVHQIGDYYDCFAEITTPY